MAQQFADQQQYEYYQQFFDNPYFQTAEPHKDIGPHPGITHEEFNHYDINQQRDFLKFLREIAFYYHRSLPTYQKSMEEFLNKNLSYNMTQEEHQLMDQYLYVIKEQKEYEARLKLLELETEQVKPEQKEVQEIKVEPKVEPKVEEPIEQKQEVPKAEGQTAPKKKLRLAKPFEAPKPPQAPEYPKAPTFLDLQKFQALYYHYLHLFQPQTEEEYIKFPTPQEQKAKQDKEEEKKKRKQDEIKRAEEKRKQAIENAKKPKQTEVNEKKVDIDNLEIDLSVFIDPDETRQPINLVFIGHVDAGKSTLCGRILLELGEVSETDIKKFEQEANQNNRESWWLAYVMDQNEDERAKGKTVECGKAQFLTKTKRFSLADAPGHKSYVQNMIMGACQADVAGLIISAKQGEFESGFEKGGQTQEHALLAKSLGVSILIVIVTKMDLIDWNQDRFKLITDQVVDFAQKQCNFQNIQIIPIDALSGNNISKPPDPAKCKWYTGPCLLDLLDNIPLPKSNDEGPIRIPILDKFKDLGSTYIYGKLESGKIVDGLDVTIYPKKLSFQIAGIYNHKDQRLKYAKAGENIKIKVKNIDDEEIKRGQMVCNLQSNPCQITTEFQAKLKLIELPENQRIISTGYQCIMHLHSIVEEIDLIVEASWDPESKTYIKQNFLKSMSEGIVRITTKNPICLEKCDVIPQLGRFALRGEGRSLGFGEVTKIKPFKAN